jgi:hypothetical protein
MERHARALPADRCSPLVSRESLDGATMRVVVIARDRERRFWFCAIASRCIHDSAQGTMAALVSASPRHTAVLAALSSGFRGRLRMAAVGLSAGSAWQRLDGCTGLFQIATPLQRFRLSSIHPRHHSRGATPVAEQESAYSVIISSVWRLSRRNRGGAKARACTRSRPASRILNFSRRRWHAPQRYVCGSRATRAESDSVRLVRPPFECVASRAARGALVADKSESRPIERSATGALPLPRWLLAVNAGGVPVDPTPEQRGSRIAVGAGMPAQRGAREGLREADGNLGQDYGDSSASSATPPV